MRIGQKDHEMARRLHVSRNTVAKHADMGDMPPAPPLRAGVRLVGGLVAGGARAEGPDLAGVPRAARCDYVCGGETRLD